MLQRMKFQTPVGCLAVEVSAGRIVGIGLQAFHHQAAEVRPLGSCRGVFSRVADQLAAYFGGRRREFTLPLDLRGTAFQQRVWLALRTIPAGEVRTYGEVAKALGSHARAVGMACRHNPVPLVVPCHRVVAADGLGGFSGQTAGPALALKRWLLEHEGALPTPLAAD